MDNSFYFARGDTSWSDVCQRVSGIMPATSREEVRDALERKLFLPGTPILRNANAQGSLNMLSCHNIRVENSVYEIWQAAEDMALVLKSGGGGVGIELSMLSPRGTRLKYISPSHQESGVASGPTSFLRLFILTGELIGSARSGKDSGIMALLSAHHEDVTEWIMAKDEDDGALRLCNLSCSFLSGPDSVSDDVWEQIVYQAWKNGTPGVAFLDNINKRNPVLEEFGPIVTLNVCAENPAYSYEGCMLSSILLHNVVDRLGDWEELRRVARLQALLLNRAVDVNHYPLPQFREIAHDLRRIGGGVMGFSTLLKREKIPLYSEEANAIGSEMVWEIYDASDKASWELAREEGGYRKGCRRNVSLMALAPNGHGAILGNCSPSIYCDLYNPEEYSTHLRTTPEEHINHIKAWQDVVDGGVAYTVSIPNDSVPGQVDEIYRRAYDAGLKAVSVYRDDSLRGQPLCKLDGGCE